MRAYELREDYAKDWQQIEQDCSHAIQLARRGLLLYRGSSSTNKPDIFQSRSRDDRLPMSTTKGTQTLLDAWFADHGFTARRGNSIFCSGWHGTASAYTNAVPAGVFIIFPFDDAAITWSPKIRDLYSQISTMQYTVYMQVRHDLPLNSSGSPSTEEVASEVDRVFVETLTQLMDTSMYIKGDLEGAIASHHEVMVSGRYWAVREARYKLFN